MFAHRKLFPRDHVRFRTPRRLPDGHWFAAPPVDEFLHAKNAGATSASLHLGPEPARIGFWFSEFDPQLAVMLLSRGECRLPPTVLLVGEERRMNLAPPCQPHEETMITLGRLINPADTGRA